MLAARQLRLQSRGMSDEQQKKLVRSATAWLERRCGHGVTLESRPLALEALAERRVAS